MCLLLLILLLKLALAPVLVLVSILHALSHILVLELVLVLVLVLVLEDAVLSHGSTHTFIPTVLRLPVVLEGVTALPTEPPTAGHAGGRLHLLLCSILGLLADPLLLEEGLLKNALHPCC